MTKRGGNSYNVFTFREKWIEIKIKREKNPVRHFWSNAIYHILPNSFLPWIVSPLNSFHCKFRKQKIMRKLYENFQVFHFSILQSRSALKRTPMQDFNYFSIMFYYNISTTYQKIGDLFCPVIVLDFTVCHSYSDSDPDPSSVMYV